MSERAWKLVQMITAFDGNPATFTEQDLVELLDKAFEEVSEETAERVRREMENEITNQS